jgi:hypothetical protein
MIINITLDYRDLDMAEVDYGKIELTQSTVAFIKYGQLFDVLIHRACKIGSLVIQERKSGLSVRIKNSTCFRSHEEEEVEIFVSESIERKWNSLELFLPNQGPLFDI